jgi:hypothetical protein
MSEQDAVRAAGLRRRSRALGVVTVFLVLLVSPLSFVLSYPFGVPAQAWLSVWIHYVFIFIVLAIAIAISGFGAASTYRVRAEKLSQKS